MSDERRIVFVRNGLGSCASRSAAVIVMAAMALVLATPMGASAKKPAYTCPPGFNLGGLTADQALRLPNVVSGLAAGEYDEAFVRAIQDLVDMNGDGVICFQTYPTNAAPNSLHQYYYNVVDNMASVPSG